ncbi:hypothetical protein, partial [Piscirickettsia litoralis]
MKNLLLMLMLTTPFYTIASQHSVNHNQKNIETIVIVRHAEKPSAGLGQLTCRGLNRSLALPSFFIKHYPKPNFIFAPNPAVKAYEMHGDKRFYNYVRPLATIEPTAIYYGLPVNTEIGYNQPRLLVNNLLRNKYHNSTIYIAWEHREILKISDILLKYFNNNQKVPSWPNSDYNTVF